MARHRHRLPGRTRDASHVGHNAPAARHHTVKEQSILVVSAVELVRSGSPPTTTACWPRNAGVHQRSPRSALILRTRWNPSPCDRPSRPRTTTGPPVPPRRHQPTTGIVPTSLSNATRATPGAFCLFDAASGNRRGQRGRGRARWLPRSGDVEEHRRASYGCGTAPVRMGG